MGLPPFTGAVLAGGRSRRMGTDKAFAEIAGRPLISCALDALAGASQRLIVGGDNPRLDQVASTAHATHVPDRRPGEGPLGAVITALGQARYPITVVLPCDLPGITGADVVALVEAVSEPGSCRERPTSPADPVVAVFADERRHYLPLAINTDAAARAERLFERGERSVASLLDTATVREVPASPGAVTDIDTPEDLLRAGSGEAC